MIVSFNDLKQDDLVTFFLKKENEKEEKKKNEGYNRGTQTWNADDFSWNLSCCQIHCLRG